MASSSRSGFTQSPVCEEDPEIIYAWAMDAPALTLPEGKNFFLFKFSSKSLSEKFSSLGVGFKVGGDTKINFLVLQVHYANVNQFLNGKRDSSGITLTLLDGSSKR